MFAYFINAQVLKLLYKKNYLEKTGYALLRFNKTFFVAERK